MAKSAEKRFFHWFLEFPEVFSNGGFDCILGNPPFLGDRKLQKAFGNYFLEFITGARNQTKARKVTASRLCDHC